MGVLPPAPCSYLLSVLSVCSGLPTSLEISCSLLAGLGTDSSVEPGLRLSQGPPASHYHHPHCMPLCELSGLDSSSGQVRCLSHFRTSNGRSLGYGLCCDPGSGDALCRLALFSRDILTTVPAKEQHSAFPHVTPLAAKTVLQRGAPLHTGFSIILREHVCERPRS